MSVWGFLFGIAGGWVVWRRVQRRRRQARRLKLKLQARGYAYMD